MTREELRAKYWFLEMTYSDLTKTYLMDLKKVVENNPDKLKLPLDVEL